MIIIARREVSARIACLFSDVHVVAFQNLQEFDRWRAGLVVRDETIRLDVEQALLELGCPLPALTQRLQATLEGLCYEPVVPAVPDIERSWPSRRSFYRAWAAELPVPPAVFLRRVRTLRAERLITGGASPREAAIRTGFGSVDRLRRLIAQRRDALDGAAAEQPN